MALTHSDAWYERQNKIFGLPRGTRHQDAWYTRAHEQQNAQVAADQAGALQKEIADTAARKAEIERQDAPPPPPPPPPPATPAGPTAEELAATAHAEAQAREAAARDAWDRLNSQGAYDLDGWQSIGYQPDRVGMPAGWAANNWLPPTPPAPPPAAASTLPPWILQHPVAAETPPASNVSQSAPSVTQAAPNALTQLFGPVAPAAASAAPAAQSWNQPQALAPTAQPAQGNWGAGGLFSAQQPDAGAWGDQPGTWKKPAAQTSPWMQPKPAGQNPTLGLWGQKPPRTPGAQPWGQKPAQAGTWGLGTQWS